MKIAYLIATHRLPEQVGRLVQRLEAPSATIFVHVDRDVDPAAHEAIVSPIFGRSNVYFLPRRSSPWSGWGMVAVMLDGLTQIIRSGLQPDVVILLSGQDYPLQRPSEIEAFFARHPGASFIDVRQLPDYRWNPGGVIDRFGGRPLPNGMVPFGGSTWWALSGDCAAYVAGAASDPELIDYFTSVGCVDEHFVQTVIGNSPFRDRIRRIGGEHVLGVHYIDWHRGPPKVLGMEDLGRLVASDALFARKFDATSDAAVLDAIDARLDGIPIDDGAASDGADLVGRLALEVHRGLAAMDELENVARGLRGNGDARRPRPGKRKKRDA